MRDRFRMQCASVKYRQGFIEVVAQIHPGLVNIETWQVSAEADITGLDPSSDRLTDDDFVANTEMELTPAQARSLAAALVAAAATVEAEPNAPTDGPISSW
jgi:hypothetical protein